VFVFVFVCVYACLFKKENGMCKLV